MSDHKAISQTNQSLQTEINFPFHPAKPANLPAFNDISLRNKENALFPPCKNSDLSVSSHVIHKNSKNLFAGGAGVAEKTSPEFPAAGDDGNRQNLRGGSSPDH